MRANLQQGSTGAGHSYRGDIDGLRAVAVLAVVLFHAFPGKFPGGFIGVDIFFVISGYLITSIIVADLQQGRFSFAGFYSRRIRRIFPALLTVMAAALVIGWPLMLGAEYAGLGTHVGAGVLFVSNLLLFHEFGYFDKAAELKPLLHLWSLAVEEQFYIVWPAIVVLFWRPLSRTKLLGAMAVILLASFAANVHLAASQPSAAFYWPVSRFWELMAGAVLALRMGPLRSLAPRWANAASATGVALILIGFATIDRNRAFPGWWALLPVLSTAFIIMAGPHAWINAKLLSARGMVGIGLISYPLYLWHWLLLSFGHIYRNYYMSPMEKAGLLLLSAALAWATYALVEKPFRFGHQKAALTRRLLGGMTLLLLVAVLVHAGVLRNRSMYYEVEMSEAFIERTKASFWEGNDVNYMGGSPKVLVFGDSQARDLFIALRNDPAIGLRYFSSPAACMAFGEPVAGSGRDAALCQERFAQLLASDSLKSADILIYSRLGPDVPQDMQAFRRNIEKIKSLNTRLEVQVWGPKPHLGNRELSIRRIMRDYDGVTGIAAYLEGVAIRQPTDALKRAVRDLGLAWVDVAEVYCTPTCMFHEAGEYAYFDNDHWTGLGARTFYDRLQRSGQFPAVKRP